MVLGGRVNARFAGIQLIGHKPNELGTRLA